MSKIWVAFLNAAPRKWWACCWPVRFLEHLVALQDAYYLPPASGEEDEGDEGASESDADATEESSSDDDEGPKPRRPRGAMAANKGATTSEDNEGELPPNSCRQTAFWPLTL